MTKAKSALLVGMVATFVAVAAPAASGVIHRVFGPTEREAMKAATERAKSLARLKGTCFKPAWELLECEAVDGGFVCRADTANQQGSCLRDGWYRPTPYPATAASQAIGPATSGQFTAEQLASDSADVD